MATEIVYDGIIEKTTHKPPNKKVPFSHLVMRHMQFILFVEVSAYHKCFNSNLCNEFQSF